LTSIEDLVGIEYGIGSKEGQEESQVTSDLDNGKDKKKNEEKKNQKAKQHCIAYKYSNKGRDVLHEAVILAGRPVFLKYENGEIKIVESMEEASRIIKPPHPEEYPYEPYEFANMDEVTNVRGRKQYQKGK